MSSLRRFGLVLILSILAASGQAAWAAPDPTPAELAASSAAAADQSAQAAVKAASSAAAADKAAQAAGKAASSAATSASAVEIDVWAAPGTFWQYAIPAAILIASLVALARIQQALDKTDWSLADALSEETPLTHNKVTETVDPATKITTRVTELEKDKDGKPILSSELRASSSRVIALMGMMVIVLMFLGFGVFAMFSFGATGKLPDSIDKLIKFLAAGMTLFAPYVVNKFASLFSGLSGSK